MLKLIKKKQVICHTENNSLSFKTSQTKTLLKTVLKLNQIISRLTQLCVYIRTSISLHDDQNQLVPDDITIHFSQPQKCSLSLLWLDVLDKHYRANLPLEPPPWVVPHRPSDKLLSMSHSKAGRQVFRTK